MKNLKEIKLMMERLESPRLTDTELQKKMSLLKEEETSHDIQDRLHSFIDELAALLSGWYLSYDMEPHDEWDNQLFASSAYGNKIKNKMSMQKGADKKEKMMSFWKNSEKHYGMEGKEPSGYKDEDAIVFGKEVGKRTSLPSISQIRMALDSGQSGGNQESSIIRSVTGMKPEDFFRTITRIEESQQKVEEGQNKMASEEQLEFMVDRIPATLSVKGVSNYELEKLISQNKMKMNFMNGVIGWVDKDSKLYQMGKDSRILNGVDRTNEIINHLESKGYTQSPDVPVY